jgi:hypothetical protein
VGLYLGILTLSPSLVAGLNASRTSRIALLIGQQLRRGTRHNPPFLVLLRPELLGTSEARLHPSGLPGCLEISPASVRMQQGGRRVRARLFDLIIVLVHGVPSGRDTLYEWPVATMLMQLLLEVIDEEVHRLLQLVQRHVVAFAALSLLFEGLKEMFCVAKQAPLSLRQLTGTELRLSWTKLDIPNCREMALVMVYHQLFQRAMLGE